ncbi:alpha-1,6-glucosidases, pullulanase-type [Sanguibacter gelidistatuariae]|uniref:Alpha-1,6-glucosidases, pullulanase-type n=1 Tax=Sanguibacter gelidistatuariae TaxID=1814289 RepID=A0A1G6KUV3_9MICO|nr:pullulanase-type alpha-1,6-glucosidase [Sanguibacter gelidistatuariae]SDC34608.1 alpha-1,6-glucosidases, pullulanase-type [Sanguibacter gelidistatuariae]
MPALLAATALASASLVALPAAAPASAAPPVYRLVGDLQSELGCAADWLPECIDGELVASTIDGLFAGEFSLPGGSYEFKVLSGGTWDDQAWGRAGATGPDAANIRLTVAGDTTMTVVFDEVSGRTSIVPVDPVAAPVEADAPAPVRQPGSDEQFYFVLTDRFANGDPSNDNGHIIVDGTASADRAVTGFDPTDKGFYHGGDIAGLRNNLDYIEGLGTTAIWLTPSFKNNAVQGTGDDMSAGYHGYWVTDFTQIDPHLGTNAELDALIDDAHARGMKVYFDIIANHTADIIDYKEGVYTFRAPPEEPYTPSIPAGLETIKQPTWLNDTSFYNNRGNSTWEGPSVILGDFDGLDDLDTSQQPVVDGFIDIYTFWAKSGIDGFRIDTVKHVDFSFWEQWTTAIKAATTDNPDFFMFGEIYDADPSKLSPYVRGTDMDSVLDFTYQSAASSYANGNTAKGLQLLFAGDDYYTTATKNAYALPTFLGNHDMGRLGFVVKDQPDALERSELAHSLMYLTRGQPVVYYGDEQGFVGSSGDGKDKNARQSLFDSQVPEFNNQVLLDGSSGAGDHYSTSGALYTHIAELAALRTANPALSDGAQIEQYVSAGTGIYAFSRVDTAAAAPVEYVVAVNNATEEKTAELTALTPSAAFAPLYGTTAGESSDTDGTLSVTVPALSAVVLVAGSPITADTTAIAPTFTTPTLGQGLAGLQEITVDLGTERYAETSISYRVAGASAWTLLGTVDDGAPRLFQDMSALAPGTVMEYRAVVRDAAGNLTQAVTSASIGDDHGTGTPVEVDPSDRLTIPGSHGASMGCAGWDPACFDAELLKGANGLYSGTFDVTAGTYEHKYAFGGDWSNNFGVGGVHNSTTGNYSYTHPGGERTFYFDPATKLGTSVPAGSPLYTLAGNFQTQLGCAADYSDACIGGELTPGTDGTYTYATDKLTPGTYKAKAIQDLSWDTSFGDVSGADVTFTVTAESPLVTFTFDPVTSVLTAVAAAPPVTEGPAPLRDVTVSIAGTVNTAMGCVANWKETCVEAELTNRTGSVFSQSFDLPAGTYEYKAVISHSWGESYGLTRVSGGDNISFTLPTDATVTFVYDDASHFVTHFFDGSTQGRIAVAAGSFQSEQGCAADWDPACLASWLQNYDRDRKVYHLETDRLPAGTYDAKAVFGLTWDEAYPGGNVTFIVPTDWAKMIFRFDLELQELVIAADDSVPGDGDRAYWLDAQTLAIPTSALPAGADLADRTWTLHGAPTGGITVAEGAVTTPVGGVDLPLTLLDGGLPADLRAAYPHVAGYLALRLGDDVDAAQVADVLTGELRLTQSGPDALEYSTGVQIAGVLDDQFTVDAGRALGATWAGAVPSLALWAPTAKSVTATVWPEGNGTATGEAVKVSATRQSDGTWTTPGQGSWKNAAYVYDVEVFVHSTGAVEHNVVTDPYSVGLTLNSKQSVLVDLADPAFAPTLWSQTPAPIVERDVDRSIYELHVRDFSITDTSVPEAERGTYKAFTRDSAGMEHLRTLADAGMNTVHLLPTFDIATIEEDRSVQAVTGDLSGFAADSPAQQAAVTEIADTDGFNWGYDPLHFQVAEGSYATAGNQEGGARTAEFRSMVGALHGSGLQVVLDQVFNHTAASGQDDRSILDRVVPGYYHRLSATGSVETSTCCENVATENAMAERLMVDSVVTWARDYHVDGFRFDLMGHHSTSNMLAVRAGLDALTLADDGVDGSSIYLYGEGWNFGEIADNARFTQATQGQLGGTGIGTFSDRLRDAVHGGSPVDGASLFQQGFGTGLGTDPNGLPARQGDDSTVNDGSAEELADLAHQSDLVRLGLAGNLRAYSFETSSGEVQRGDQIDYRGAPAGYADSPEEVVSYVDAHDNETLFDILTLKLPLDTSMADRVRMNTLSLATTALSQTPSFWHAGTDLLRSKSLDRDSYNSGDHFNAIDWTGTQNNFGMGLPLEGKNGESWDVQGPLLANPALKPATADITTATQGAQDLLRLRYSTPLFRLGTGASIQEKVTFPGSGTGAVPGVIVMRVDDTVGADVDPALAGMLVVFNASPSAVTQTVDGLVGHELTLSQVQTDGTDPVVRTTAWDATAGQVTVPARTVAVLEEVQATDPVDPVDPVDPSAPTASVSLSATSVRPGETVTVTGSGFAPGETVQVWIHSTPQLLAARVAGADGTFTAAVTVPVDATVGKHAIRVVGLTSALEASAPLTVVAVVGGGGELGTTGFSPIIGVAGVLLLILGAGVYLTARNRREELDTL